MDNRIEQVNNLIQQILAELIARHLCADKNIVVSLTRVQTTGNLQAAKVYISVIPDSKRDSVVSTLSQDVIFFQKILNKKLCMRPVPRIEFVPDTAPEATQEVERILEEIKDGRGALAEE